MEHVGGTHLPGGSTLHTVGRVEVTVQIVVPASYYKSGECVLGDTDACMCVSVCLNGVSGRCVAAPVCPECKIIAEGTSK